jgi:hypothetical protein
MGLDPIAGGLVAAALAYEVDLDMRELVHALAPRRKPALFVETCVDILGLAATAILDAIGPGAPLRAGRVLSIEGDGLAFLHASGTLHELKLSGAESLRVDTGCIVAMDESVDYDIQMVPGVKTALFGGEGLFFALLKGPGRVILQTMPFSRLADRIIAASPRAGGSRREEGSVLGALGGLLDGDN